jgi:hypothetical protein
LLAATEHAHPAIAAVEDNDPVEGLPRRHSISSATGVLPVFIGNPRDRPGSLLRLPIVEPAFCLGTSPNSRHPKRTSVNWAER